MQKVLTHNKINSEKFSESRNLKPKEDKTLVWQARRGKTMSTSTLVIYNIHQPLWCLNKSCFH